MLFSVTPANVTWWIAFALLAVVAIIRVLCCKDAFGTLPWNLQSNSKAVKVVCYVLMVLAMFAGVVSISFRCADWSAVLNWAAVLVCIVSGYVFFCAAFIWIYVVQFLFVGLEAIAFFFYMFAEHFKK